jgi:serine/threonine protein kinase
MGVLAREIEATYEVLAKMGEGGMGAVYKVRHRFFDEVRVIKVMQAQFEAVDELKERFLGEARRGKQLRHPNLAEVLDFSIAADGTSYIVMEFIEGLNLRELTARNGGPLDFRTLVPIAVQALAAVGFLHSRKFVHRDISPDNIMVMNDGRAKLIDLGVAKSLEATRSLTMPGSSSGRCSTRRPSSSAARSTRAATSTPSAWCCTRR